MTEAEVPELVRSLQEVCTARDVPFALMVGALEESLAVAYREHTGSSSVIARFDERTGGIEIHERRVVVAEVTDSLLEVALASVPGFAIGDFVDRKLEPGSFARIAALSAKRIMFARILEFERERVFANYKALEGTLVEGLVQRDVAGALYVLLDNRNEAAMPPWERSPRERHQINQRVLCELQAVRKTRRGPALFLSRASERFVRLLVPDRAVVRGARDPGRLTLLLTTRPVDVAAAREQIGNERIEQVRFSDDPLEVMRNAFLSVPEFITSPHFDGVIAVTEDQRIHDRAKIVGRLAGRSIIAVRPADVDELLADLKSQADVTPAPVADIAEIDPELVRKLQEYARERDASESE